ncbi:ABC transporter substrate-binding protein [Haematomicrobium sanguinis]|uniref:ABC transporter substrate-binding protein n=1 Tax=Haematomicrobium sanguinis TaxID=479106 RepID=UPI00047A2B54|nr:extracellular solute-binding protein [Haematomicrobium sanguinis]
MAAPKSPASTPPREPHHLSRRQALGLAGGAALLPLLAGCGNDAVKDITYLNAKSEIKEFLDTLVGGFNESQNDVRVKVDFDFVKFVPSLVRGKPFNAVTMNLRWDTAQYGLRGVFRDLSDLPIVADMNPDMMELTRGFGALEGQTSILPFAIAGAGVLYNKAIFRDLRLEVPRTWPEFKKVAKALGDAGKIPVYGTFRDAWTLQQGPFDAAAGGLVDVQGFFDQMYALGPDFSPDTSPVSFQKDYVDAAIRVVELFQFSQKGASTALYQNGHAAMARGEAGMYIMGPWGIAPIMAINPELELGTFPAPMTDDPDGAKVRVNVDMFVGIPREASNQDASLKFVEWLVSKPVIDEYTSANGAYSPLKNAPVPTDPKIDGLNEAMAAGRFFQGASTYMLSGMQLEPLLQQLTFDRNVDAFLRAVDDDWARVARRPSASLKDGSAS